MADETERRKSVCTVIPRDFTNHAVGHFIVVHPYDPFIRMSNVQTEQGIIRQEMMRLENDEFVLS